MLGLACACATTAHEQPAPTLSAPPSPPPVEQVDAGTPEDTAQVEDAGAKTLRPELAVAVGGYLGVLDRQGLKAVIDQGLGRLFGKLKLSASMRAGRFEGFRVTDIDPAWEGAGLVVGDVLQRVNGQPIERPEQAQVAFDSLRVASEVAVQLLRNDQKLTLRYRVE